MKTPILRIGRWSWGLVVPWTAILFSSYVWNAHQVQSLLLDQARTELRTNFFKDQTFREWATKHGGVYVPVTETQQPDPYIDFIPERDITTPSGTKLTLINPALMVRQFNELARDKYAIEGRISGIKPLNPINRADPWEHQAFDQFRQGRKEITEVTTMNGAPYLRLIRPMFMGKSCLKCHAHQGFKVDDLSGGVSVSVPLAPIEKLKDERMFTLKGGHALIWLLGLLGILWGKRQIAVQVNQREEAYQALEENEEKTRTIIASSMDAIITADASGTITGWNEHSTKIFGWRQDEALGKQLAPLIIPQRYRDAHNKGFERALENQSEKMLHSRVEVTGHHKDGHEMPLELSITSIAIAGKPGFSAFIRDISQQKQDKEKIENDYLAQQLIASVLEISLRPIGFKERLEQILQQIVTIPSLSLQAKGSVFIQTESGQLEMAAQHGLPETTIANCSTIEMGECLCGLAALTQETVYKSCMDSEHRSTHADDHGHYCLPIQSGERLLGVLNLYLEHGHRRNEDEITLLSSVSHTIGSMIQRHEAEQSLIHNAYHDKLTGLPNRTLFLDRLKQRMARYERTPNESFAVLFLDLDRFKVINDSLGHTVGDQLLISVANRLRDALRPEDTLARLGGDEFTLLLEDVSSERNVSQVAERIYDTLRDPAEVNGLELFAPCSIGVAFSSSRYQQPEEMLRDADTAMYRAKSSNSIHTVFFDEAMHTIALNRLTMETELLRAFENNELAVYYQPIICAKTGRIEGVEALSRWPQADGSMVSPADFIPVAEETGLINDIGIWVLREACRQAAEWQKALPEFSKLYVSVNLSGKQLLQADLFSFIEAILQGIDYDPKNLRLEITESTLIDDSETTATLLKSFREKGYRFYIDDFGTGYSSLSYLHSFPFDALKIDRSFVSKLDEGEEHKKMIETIISIAHNFNMRVIAEGVETAQQLEEIKSMGCEYIQGFFFSRPLPATELFKLLENSR